MNHKIKELLKTVTVETEVDGVKLKGTLEYWAKDYKLTLDEPFKYGAGGGHLILASPIKYVIEKSQNPSHKEIDLLEESKEKLKSVYKNKIDNKGNK